MKNKKNGYNMMGMAKQTVGTGMVSMAGLGAMGHIAGQVPAGTASASAATTVGVVGSGLTLANVGNLAKTGMGIAGMMGGMKSKKKSGNRYIDRIM